MERLKADPLSLSGLPRFDELSKFAEIELVSQVKLKYLRERKPLRQMLNECYVPQVDTASTSHERGRSEARSLLQEFPDLRGSLIFSKGTDRTACLQQPGYSGFVLWRWRSLQRTGEADRGMGYQLRSPHFFAPGPTTP